MALMLVCPGVLLRVTHPQPINYRHVGDEAESSCLRVTSVEMLLHDTLASVDQNILHPIQVSLKREENLARKLLASSTLSHRLPCFVSAALVLGQHGRACVADGGDPDIGGNRCYGSHPRRGGTWELEEELKSDYPNLFSNISYSQGQDSFKGGWFVTPVF
jgi:hypothetical protein